MNYAELVQLYFERSNALQNYWTLYVVILGGLLAFSSMRQIPNRLTTVLVTVLFCCFAYKNCGAIVDVTHQREAARAALVEESGHLKDMVDAGRANAMRGMDLLPTMIGTNAGGVRRFHVLCDALTILTLWSMEWRRCSRQRELVRTTEGMP